LNWNTSQFGTALKKTKILGLNKYRNNVFIFINKSGSSQVKLNSVKLSKDINELIAAKVVNVF